MLASSINMLRGQLTPVTGTFTDSSSDANGRDIATLPLGVRPSKPRAFILPAVVGSLVRIIVMDTGVLRVIQANSATKIYLDQVVFSLD